MVFCKTASFFLGVEVLRNGYTLNGFSFSIHRRLAISDEKKVEKKKKDAWQNERFCDTFFFACGALKQRGVNKLVFEIKGKGKKKKPKSKNLW